MNLATLLIVGLIAGFLADLVVKRVEFGLLGKLIAGVVGAFVGGWLFSLLGISDPVGGFLGQILVAFIGAVIVLLLVSYFMTSDSYRDYRKRRF